MAQQMSPQLAQEVLSFQQQHPNFDLSTGFNRFGPIFQNGLSDPQAAVDFLKLQGDLNKEGYHLNSSGDPAQNMAAWKQILLGAATVAAPGVAYAALPAGTAAATGESAAGTAGTDAAASSVLPATTTVPTTGSLAADGTGLAGVDTSLAGGTAAGTSAATASAAGSAGSSIWKQILLGGAIPAAATVGGAAIAASASTKAAQIQAAETDKQLAQAKEIYEQERADEAPYRQAGGYSLNALNFGLGLPAVDLNPAPTTSGASGASGPTTTTKGGTVLPARTQPAGSPTLGTAVPRDTYTMNTLNAIGGNSGTTRMQAPNGNIYFVPNADVAARIQDGGQVVG